MVKELILNALMMAIRRRKPKQRVTIHSDQGSQFTSYDWHNFLDDHNLQVSMSRRENCSRKLFPAFRARASETKNLLDKGRSKTRHF